ETSLAELSIEDKPLPVPAPAPAAEEEAPAAEPVKEEDLEADIFSSKVIACAINNPEACEMCSG
ncbi:hypothetical protein WICMUC_001981, partial [Wickerhamomyces mucosus]